ncbi:MAG: RidA family protein [Acidobacteria bacterium]|nr:MAG: RidA family protein [Acidobacteriota bacterium]
MSNALGIHKDLTKLVQPLKVDADPAAGYSAGAAQAQGGIQKLGYDGQPAKGGIAPVVVHNGLIYVAGQGANEHQEEATLDITTHVQKAMDNVKKLVEVAGGDMDHVLQLTVYLATLEFYDAMNKAYRPYFPNGGPARCTVSVAGIPGRSLIEISCIAAVVRQ